MYHWNTSALSQRLKANDLSEKEKMHYYLAMMLIWGGTTLNAFYEFSPDVTWEDYVLDAVTLAITVFGILYAFKQNENAPNFVERAVALSWPLFIRLFVFVLPVALAVAVVQTSAPSLRPVGKIPETLILTGAAVFYYYRLAYWIRESRP